MTAPQTSSPHDTRFPWALTLAGVVACVAMWLTGGRFFGVLVLGALAVGAKVAPGGGSEGGGGWRLPDRFLVRWGLRGLVFGAILTVMGFPAGEVTLWYIKPEFMQRIGPLMAAEFVLRAWLGVDPAQRGRHWAEALFISGLIFIPATTTYDRAYITWLAPLYVALTMLTVRRVVVAYTPAAQEGTGVRDDGGGRVASRRRTSAVVMRVAAGVAAIAIGLGVVSAVTAFDRQVSSWAVRLLQSDRVRQTEVGLSTTPQLRGIFNPEGSLERAMLLDGVRGERHVRVVAFDQYAGGPGGGTWRPAMNERGWTAVDARVLRNTAGGRPGRRIRVVPLTDVLRELIAIPVGTGAVRADAPLERDGWGSLRVAGVGREGGRRNTGEPGTGGGGEGLAEFEVETTEGEAGATGSGGMAIPILPAPTEDELKRLTEFPDTVDPRVAELARDVAGTGEPAERVYRIMMHLRSKHAYSLSFEPQGDPLSDFVLNGKAAHCQYFGSAMVVMARAAGVPARFATGYYAHEAADEAVSSPEGGTLVRERDAHAWAEVYIAGAGWVVADATPAGGRPDALFEPVSATRKFWERVLDAPGRLRAWLAEGGLVRTMWVVGGLAAAVLAARAIRGWWRRRHADIGLRGLAVDPRLAELAARFERSLSQRGVTLKPTETWREQLAGHAGVEAGPFLAAYEAARFGPGGEAAVRAAAGELAKLETTPAATTAPGRT